MSRFSMSHIDRPTLHPLMRALITAGLLGVAPFTSIAQTALPTGASTPVIGQATVVTGRDQVGPTMTIEQTSNLAVFRWDTFNVGAGATLSHVMAKSNPNPQALTVHHVYDLKLGPSMATIAGTMRSDHGVFLISAGGVRVASGAVIEAPTLLLSSHELDAEQFGRGTYSGLKEGAVLKLVGAAANQNGYDNGVVIEAPARLTVGENGGLALLGGQVQVGGTLQGRAGAKILVAASAGAEVPLTDSGFLTINVRHDLNSSSNYVSLYGRIEGAGADGKAGDVAVESGASLYMGAGSSIVSTSGPVNVSMRTGMSGGSNGEAYLSGYSYSDYPQALAVTQAPSAVSPTNGWVTIETGGGDFKMSGGSGAQGVWLSNVAINAGAGDIDIRARRTDSSEGGMSAIDVRQSILSGKHVLLEGSGSGTDVNGITLVNTEIRSTDGVTLRGVAADGGVYGGIGLDFQQTVTLHGGTRGVELYGRGGTQGLRFGDLTLTSSGQQGGRFVLAGQTLTGALPGIGLGVQQQGRLRIQDEQGRASPADLIVGGVGGPDAALAIDLGQGVNAPTLNLTGRYNLRPLGVNEQGQIVEQFDTPIVLGKVDASVPGQMLLLPEWFNGAASEGKIGLMSTVIGSKGHRGSIKVLDGAIDGMAEVTLQNQGRGSQGIELGASRQVGILNLVSGGGIGQTGPLAVESLRVLVPEGGTVSLTHPLNQIRSLSYRGVGEGAFGGAFTTSSNGRVGISAFNPDVTNGQFETLIVERQMPTAPVVESSTVDERTSGVRAMIPRVLEEQRTDVYVRDAFNKPQVCTGVTAAAQSILTDASVEPLTLEWLKVRQSPQLSSCSGARVNASCSVF